MKHSIILCCILCLPFQILQASTQEVYPFALKHQAVQFQRLTHDLRCLVCQNQNLADSHAKLAIDLKNQVYNMVLADKSDKEIIEYLRKRYGDFILFKPPLKNSTYLLWFTPFILMLFSLGLLILIIRQRSLALKTQ